MTSGCTLRRAPLCAGRSEIALNLAPEAVYWRSWETQSPFLRFVGLGLLRGLEVFHLPCVTDSQRRTGRNASRKNLADLLDMPPGDSVILLAVRFLTGFVPVRPWLYWLFSLGRIRFPAEGKRDDVFHVSRGVGACGGPVAG